MEGHLSGFCSFSGNVTVSVSCWLSGLARVFVKACADFVLNSSLLVVLCRVPIAPPPGVAGPHGRHGDVQERLPGVHVT